MVDDLTVVYAVSFEYAHPHHPPPPPSVDDDARVDQVFGTPLVCRVVPMTGRQLYDKLYRRFHRFLRLKSGAVSPAAPARRGGRSDAGGGVMELDGSDGCDTDDEGARPCMGTGEDEDCPQVVRGTSMWVAAGEVNRWGFR